MDSNFDIKFKQLKMIFENLPWSNAEIGIGGHPFRYPWWKSMLFFLSNSGRKIYFVDTINFLTKEKIDVINSFNNFHLIIEVEKQKDLEDIHKNQIKYEALMCSFNNIQNIIMNDNIVIEQPVTNINAIMEEYAKQFFKHYKKDICRLNEQTIVCVAIDGDVYPCVALQQKTYCLGNIFNDDEKKIKKEYGSFIKKISCKYCCQGRSVSRYKILNCDFLCNHREI
ncbi:MAG: SPASM domain-containing protein [Bdellovibrionota bacterium]